MRGYMPFYTSLTCLVAGNGMHTVTSRRCTPQIQDPTDSFRAVLLVTCTTSHHLTKDGNGYPLLTCPRVKYLMGTGSGLSHTRRCGYGFNLKSVDKKLTDNKISYPYPNTRKPGLTGGP
jgi:hypothetical protein